MAIIDKLGPTAERFGVSRAAQLLIDTAIVGAALYSAYMIRFDGELPARYLNQILMVLPFAIMLYVGINFVSFDYRRAWRFFGARDAAAIAHSVMLGFFVSIMWRVLDTGIFASEQIPLGVLAIYPLLAFSGLAGARVARRALYNRAVVETLPREPNQPRTRLLLVGAGEAGLNLLHELRETDFKVVGSWTTIEPQGPHGGRMAGVGDDARPGVHRPQASRRRSGAACQAHRRLPFSGSWPAA
jgi:FlaA1/EpsC-like NDP-sugar epimerase